MNVIIPMAGRGTRMRPHTLTTPKPLLPIAGKPIVQRLVEDIAEVLHEPIENVGFIINPHFGEEVENELYKIAEKVGAKGRLYYQEEAKGVGHAISFAEELLTGHIVIAFADTLFKAHFDINSERDGIIWVQKVDNPESFGVVKVNEEGIITQLVEKPDEYVSDLAIIGIYYFKHGEKVREEINYVIDNNIKVKGEFQFTSALENLEAKGEQFVPGEVDEWLDCGNKDVTVSTNKRYLDFVKDKKLVSDSASMENTVIIPPVFLGDNVKVKNSVIGPYVSVGENCEISDSRIENSIIQTNSHIQGANMENSMLGNFVNFMDSPDDLNLGDYTIIKR